MMMMMMSHDELARAHRDMAGQLDGPRIDLVALPPSARRPNSSDTSRADSLKKVEIIGSMFDASEANGIDFRFNICDTARLVGSYGARWLSAEPSRPLPRLVDSATHDEKHSSMSEFPESVARFVDDAPDAIA